METADELKEYFDVAVYRNILDMINTFELGVNELGIKLQNALIRTPDFVDGLTHNNLTYIHNAPDREGYRYARQPHAADERAKVMIGYSEPFVKAGKNSPRALAANVLAKAGLKNTFANVRTDTAMYYALATYETPVVVMNKYFMASNGSRVNILDIARNLEWELNRVRLPLPHNFRQLLTKVSAYLPLKQYVLGKDWIAYLDLVNVYSQLKFAISEIRKEVQKEIAAAKLWEKVNAETIRLENEELITREKAEEEAAQRKADELLLTQQQILKDAESLNETKLEMETAAIELKAKMAELDKILAEAKATNATAETVNAIQSDYVELKNKEIQVEQIAAATEVKQQTVQQAVNSVNKEIEKLPAPVVKSNNTVAIITTVLAALALGA